MTRRPSPAHAISAAIRPLVVGAGLVAVLLFAAQAVLAEATPAPSESPEASAPPSSEATPVALDVPLASPTPSPPPLRPIPPVPTPIAHPGDSTSNTCLDCHKAIGPTQRVITEQYQASAHGKAGVGC